MAFLGMNPAGRSAEFLDTMHHATVSFYGTFGQRYWWLLVWGGAKTPRNRVSHRNDIFPPPEELDGEENRFRSFVRSAPNSL